MTYIQSQRHNYRLLFRERLRTSLRITRIRCKVHNEFTSRFVHKTYDWLLNKTSQLYAQFTNLLVNSLRNLQGICEVRNEVRNRSRKSNLALTSCNIILYYIILYYIILYYIILYYIILYYIILYYIILYYIISYYIIL